MDDKFTVKQKTIKDSLYYQNVLMVKIEINYPYIENEKYNNAIMRFNQYNENMATRINTYAKIKLYRDAVDQYRYANKNDFPFNNYEIFVVYYITYDKNMLLSLYSDRYEYTGGAHGITRRIAQTWDMNRGMLLNLNSLFKPGYNYRKVILDEITKQAKEKENEGEYFFDDLEENLIKYFDPRNFYLSEDGLSIYYPLYTIAPYVAGIIVFTIPYSMFGDNLRYGL